MRTGSLDAADRGRTTAISQVSRLDDISRPSKFDEADAVDPCDCHGVVITTIERELIHILIAERDAMHVKEDRDIARPVRRRIGVAVGDSGSDAGTGIMAQMPMTICVATEVLPEGCRKTVKPAMSCVNALK